MEKVVGSEALRGKGKLVHVPSAGGRTSLLANEPGPRDVARPKSGLKSTAISGSSWSAIGSSLETFFRSRC
eukprot:905999-Pyramimonas_sp.AAC.1